MAKMTPIVLTADGKFRTPIQQGDVLDPVFWLIDPSDTYLTTQNGLRVNLNFNYTQATRTLLITGKAGQTVGTILLPAASKTIPGLAMAGSGLAVSAAGLMSVALQAGGGLTTDASGQIYVDFSLMPTDKFEALLKSLRIPIWLTRNTIWYVDSVNGNDANDGSTPAKAFKTFQYGINYAADNYNFSNYSATIQLAAGEYARAVVPYYNTTTGSLSITGAGADASEVVIKGIDSIAVSMRTGGGTVNISNLTLDMTATPGLSATTPKMCVSLESGARMTASNVIFRYREEENAIGNLTVINNSGAFTLAANCSGIFNGASTSNMYVWTTSYGATSTYGGACTFTGNFNTFARVQGGRLFRSTQRPGITATCVGKRYDITEFGVINSRGGSPEFFPGDTAGTIGPNTQYL